MQPKLPETGKAGRNRLCRGIAILIVLIGSIWSGAAFAQTYREWRDTALPEMRAIRRAAAQDGFPIGLFVYSYDFNHPFWEIVHYMNRVGIDHMIHGVRKDYDGYRQLDNWDRYQELLDSLEAHGARIIPLIDYGGWAGLPTYAGEAEHGREIAFYPFDSSQMRYWGVYENLFTFFDFDSTLINLDESNFNPNKDYPPRESIYNPASMANQTIASGIAFDHKAGQTVRWNQVYQSGAWNAVPNPVNATALFEHIDWTGDPWHTHRSPHHLVVTGHLFSNPNPVSDNTPLLRINVWYEVDKGKTYYDSSGVMQTADTNLRFLYKTVEITRGELKPVDPSNPNWNAYREAIKRVSFENEGMGGPTKDGATARRFDLEVIYLGGEKLALRGVTVRDSVASLLMDPGTAGDNYRLKIEREIDTLVRDPATGLLRPGVYNLNVADEPPYTQFAGFREVKRLIEENFAYGTDTMTSLNGTAIPFIQWLGDADWMVSGNYLGNAFYHLGELFDLTTTIGGQTLQYQDVPSARQHNGGTWHIGELFDFDSLGSASYVATLPQRIEYMETIWNHGRMGAGTPGQNLHWKFDASWRVRGLHASASRARDLGRPFQNYIGPISNISISYQQGTQAYDTNCDHRFERAELRAILRLGVLAYGARGITFYKLPTFPWGEEDDSTTGNHVPGHVLSTQEICLTGFNVADTAFDFIDWTIRDPGSFQVVNQKIINDSLGVVPGLYVGFRSAYREMTESVAWLRQIGPFMTGLRWRDAYSVHFQSDLPGSGYDDSQVQHRPLPSDEIVTAVTARHPITGAVDSAYAAYVELGLYETMIGTTGGVRDRMKDTNYIAVVNRRVFTTENYADVLEDGSGYDSATRAAMTALLDTLSETRTITLKLNLLDYYLPIDNRQYQHVRVRQLFPDTAHLPLLGKPHVLDTIVGASADIEVVLGAGRGCILQVVRVPPDESIASGLLGRNNQRKMLYDPASHRYFSTFHRFDTVSNDWHIYFRRSIPVDTTGTILWEPMEWAISKQMHGEDAPRTLNTHPSLTYRRLPSGGLRLSVVWTAHPNDTVHAPTEREVLMRDITYYWYLNGQGDTVKVMISTPLRSVGFHYGYNGEEWGTAVISSAGFGDYVAWSDSTKGIVARGRLLDTSLVFVPTWTPYDTVTLRWTDTIGMPPGKYPTLPPFAHRALNLTSVGIAWQQQWPPYTGITYGRLYYTPPSGGGPSIRIGYTTTPEELFLSPHMGLGSNTQQHVHPSIDQSQDALGRVMEGVTWERHYYAGGGNYITDVYYRSLLFDTASQMPTIVGAWINKQDGTFDADPGYGYPVISSQNQVMTPADSNEIPLFSIVYMKDDDIQSMSKRDVQWLMGDPEWRTEQPELYTFRGALPSGTAAEGRLTDRYAALYLRTDDSVLRTSREFFSRARPGGYLAEGVEVWGMVDDSLSLSIGARLYDVWKSDIYSSLPLGIAPSSNRDSLHQLLHMLRSRCFQTSDSVEIGGTVWLQLFAGDSSGAVGRSVICMTELVDSATGDVVAVLDSTVLDVEQREAYVQVDRVVDVLSGTYYVRLRLEAEGLEANVALDNAAKRSLGFVYGWVPALASKRVLRLDDMAGNRARISAQPNPFGRGTEVRFSTPRQDYVSVTVYDALGRKIGTLVDRELFDAGRYAVGFDGAGLPAGAYVIELRTSTERVVEKVMVRR